VSAAAVPAPFYADSFETAPSAATLTEVGRLLFFDQSLSASGRMACATCHDPGHAFGPANTLAVQRGGSSSRAAGVRAVMSLMYGQDVPPFTEHYLEDEGNDSADQGPAGGRTWDGRAQSAHDQARLPLLSPFEMANVSEGAVVARVKRSANAARFRAAFGARVFDDQALAFKGVLLALETYQQSSDEFYPYTSKYDAWLRHEATLTAQEARGLATFNDPAKGNCARCHPSAIRGGAFPQFTDFGYAGLGVPRNAAIPANARRGYFDLGLCGPLRTDLADRKDYCGLFRTPSLRNVALRKVYFHNGVVHRLADAVRFYAERDTRPERWYPRAPDGTIRKYDDLPEMYRANLDHETPFDPGAGERHTGDPAAGGAPLSEGDIEDLVAFLDILTDGYSVPSTASTGPPVTE
jgi:cytochrome c peroxidase